ncbi:MAG: alpha/beta fold hydrolase [Thermoleophilia bacterium]|nr:alpha/beta fold hydrolase [Thermoleophilia bacterium]
MSGVVLTRRERWYSRAVSAGGPTLAGDSGFTRDGLPYNRLGDGPRTVVAFPGLNFENRPLRGKEIRFALAPCKPLLPEYTVYVLGRRKGLREGYTLADMADDYAWAIAEEFAGPVDVLGTSTGGSLALQFGADHGDLVRKLVVHSAAYKLGPAGKELQLRVRDLARDGRWREANAALVRFVLAPTWYRGLAVRVASTLMAMNAPDDPSDLIVTIDAEDAFDLHDRLAEIAAPTLVIAGARDPFYTEELFRETAQGIPGARLVIYPDMGHPAGGAQFARELRSFLPGDPATGEGDDV